MEPEEDYWFKEDNINDEDFSISDIEEDQDEDISSSSDLRSNSDQDEIQDELSSESDHDQSDQDETDGPEERKHCEEEKINPAAIHNPNLPRMYKRNKKLLKNVAAENRAKIVFKQIEEFRPNKTFKKYELSK